MCRKICKRGLAAGMMGIMLMSTLAGCGASTSAEQVQKETEATEITEAMHAFLPRRSDTIGKEETVYIVADASGNPLDTIVSAWLKNPDGKETLEDTAALTDIRNVKGEESYTLSAGNKLTWQAEGNDIYYQGKTDKALPVSTNITYTLDGKEVQPEELAGAEGHLAITFSYRNLMQEDRVVNGKAETLYEPFLVLSGLAFNNDKAANVTIEEGKLINTGEQTIAVGFAFPGLQDSLQLANLTTDREGEEISIPTQVVVEADVVDFSLLTTITMIDNTFLQGLDLEEVHTFDDLKGAMEELAAATTQLVDGGGELYEGIDTLAEKTPELQDGIEALDSGADQLALGAKALRDGTAEMHTGASAVQNGTNALTEGADALAEGAASLSSGTAALADGAGQVDAGLQQVSEKVQGLPDGTSALYIGTKQIRDALKKDEGESLYSGMDAIENGAQALSGGLKSNDATQPGIYEAATGIRSGAQSIAEGADAISEAAATLQNEIDNLETSASGLLATLGTLRPVLGEETYAALMATAQGYLQKAEDAKAALRQMEAGADAISTGAKSGSAQNPGIYEAASSVQNGSAALAEGVDGIAAGASDLKGGIDTIVREENMGAILEGLAELSEQSRELVGGVDQLSKGASAVSSGADSAQQGAEQIAAGSRTLADSAGQLRDGTAALATGTATLQSGAESLTAGADTLHSGTTQLKEGSTALIAGVQALLSGAGALRDGLQEFQEEGIEKLDRWVTEDASDFVERLRVLQQMAAEDTTFVGDRTDPNGSVQYILRTASIG